MVRKWKKNIKENIIIFSLKNIEKNKRKKEGKNWKKIYQVGIVFTGTSARELVSQWRKRSMQRPWRGGRRRRPSYPERRWWQRPQHRTKRRARRPSWRVLFNAWRRCSKDLFFSIFFISISCLPVLCAFSPYLCLP